MLWSEYINSYKDEKTQVRFLTDYVYEVDGLVFRFIKDCQYHLPADLAVKLKESQTIELV